MKTTIPAARPARPHFSCGPASKHPGWSLKSLENAPAGRSHRSAIGKSKLKLAIELTREILQVPADYRIAIMPGSDTGAVEAALWSLLGARPVDVVAWEAFSEHWVIDIVEHLQLKDTRAVVADYGEIVDLSSLDFDHDVVFAWNGTTSGVGVQNGDFIPADRKGLTICDATSAAFAQKLDWDKLDVVTYSWQKVLGGEAAHGMLILSPRAVERLDTHTPPWPIPKLFRLTEKGQLIEAIFEGETINTPSMLCVEDYLARAQLGEIDRRPRWAHRARQRQCEGGSRLGRTDPLDRVPRRRSGDPVDDGDVPQDRRSADRRARARSRGGLRGGNRELPRESRTSPTTSAPIAMRPPACGSGAAPRSTPAISRR